MGCNERFVVMSYLKAPSSAIEETSVTTSEDRFSGPIPMSAEVQAEPCTKINRRGKTPTIALIQRGVDKAKLNKTALTSLEKSVSKANRGQVYWPTRRIKVGLAEGNLSLVKQGLDLLIKLAVTEAPKVTPKKTTKAPKVTKAAKAAATKAPKETTKKAPKETPKKTTKQAPKETGLNAKKVELIERLLKQNETIIGLLK